jgi:hypothetical protein
MTKTTLVLLALALGACREGGDGDGDADVEADAEADAGDADSDCEGDGGAGGYGYCCLWGYGGITECRVARIQGECMVFAPEDVGRWTFDPISSGDEFRPEWHEEIAADFPCIEYLGECLPNCY